ncbi:MAG: transglycosylase SLT domain-containing protein [Desulfovibrio sp.]
MDRLRGVGAFFVATCLAVFTAWLVAGCDKAEAPTVAPAAAHVAPASPAAIPDASPAVAAPGVPQRAMRYRAELIRNARVAWGLSAPVATFAAQVHQESGWRADAKSPVGAAGMAQFMPTTGRWIAGLFPELAANEPYNPSWALRALVTYDKWLWDRVSGRDACQRMAMALSAYNGGLGWVQRDKSLTGQQGGDALVWFGQVETHNAGRSAAAFRENRGYPRRILGRLEPLYIRSGFGQGVRCVCAQ